MIIKSIIIAFSTYSIIPVPKVSWEKENMRFSMCAFPLIGILTGAVIWLFCRFSVKLSLPDILRAAGLTLIPVWISGGIHLDGYLDVSDALSSRAFLL